MYLSAAIIQLLVLPLITHTFKLNVANYTLNNNTNKLICKSDFTITENNSHERHSSGIGDIPHGIADPIPSQLEFLENEKEAEIRQRLWDEQVPLEKLSERIDQLQNPDKYNKSFADFMTTSITVASYPNKSTSNDIDTIDNIETTGNENGVNSTSLENDSNDYSTSESEDYESEYEELLSFDFFQIHPAYIDLLEQLMKKKAEKAAGIDSTDEINVSNFDSKILASEYFNKAAELALDINCLVESEITNIQWILQTNKLVEQVLESHNYKLDCIKWSSDTVYILLKNKYICESETEMLQDELQKAIYKLRFKFHIPKIEMLGVFLETEPLTQL